MNRKKKELKQYALAEFAVTLWHILLYDYIYSKTNHRHYNNMFIIILYYDLQNYLNKQEISEM